MAKSPTSRGIKVAKSKTAAKARPKSAGKSQPKSKLDRIVAALRSPKGATISQLSLLTAWQPHSVRGALAGALKKRGFSITSSKADGGRIYRIEAGK